MPSLHYFAERFNEHYLPQRLKALDNFQFEGDYIAKDAFLALNGLVDLRSKCTSDDFFDKVDSAFARIKDLAWKAPDLEKTLWNDFLAVGDDQERARELLERASLLLDPARDVVSEEGSTLSAAGSDVNPKDSDRLASIWKTIFQVAGEDKDLMRAVEILKRINIRRSPAVHALFIDPSDTNIGFCIPLSAELGTMKDSTEDIVAFSISLSGSQKITLEGNFQQAIRNGYSAACQILGLPERNNEQIQLYLHPVDTVLKIEDTSIGVAAVVACVCARLRSEGLTRWRPDPSLAVTGGLEQVGNKWRVGEIGGFPAKVRAARKSLGKSCKIAAPAGNFFQSIGEFNAQDQGRTWFPLKTLEDAIRFGIIDPWAIYLESIRKTEADETEFWTNFRSALDNTSTPSADPNVQCLVDFLTNPGSSGVLPVLVPAPNGSEPARQAAQTLARFLALRRLDSLDLTERNKTPIPILADGLVSGEKEFERQMEDRFRGYAGRVNGDDTIPQALELLRTKDFGPDAPHWEMGILLAYADGTRDISQMGDGLAPWLKNKLPLDLYHSKALVFTSEEGLTVLQKCLSEHLVSQV